MKSDTVVSACAFSLRSDVGGGGMGGESLQYAVVRNVLPL
jgi:uncharacterized membrane protein